MEIHLVYTESGTVEFVTDEDLALADEFLTRLEAEAAQAERQDA